MCMYLGCTGVIGAFVSFWIGEEEKERNFLEEVKK